MPNEILKQSQVAELFSVSQSAATLYHRLVLVVGQAHSGKTRLLQATAAANDWPVINLNQKLSELMLELTQRQRALRVPRLVEGIFAATAADVVAVDNLELLFSPELTLDPLRLLQGLSRNRTVIASWPGIMLGKQLTYAVPSHPEYRRYPEPDTLWLSVSGDAASYDSRAQAQG